MTRRPANVTRARVSQTAQRWNTKRTVSNIGCLPLAAASARLHSCTAAIGIAAKMVRQLPPRWCSLHGGEPLVSTMSSGTLASDRRLMGLSGPELLLPGSGGWERRRLRSCLLCHLQGTLEK